MSKSRTAPESPVVPAWRCAECGHVEVDGPAEYHPAAFCVLYKAGFNPFNVVREAADALAMTLDDRAKLNFRQSADCADGNHAACDKRRFVGFRDGNVRTYRRCECDCHALSSEDATRPTGDKE